jgi:hypothetical protein
MFSDEHLNGNNEPAILFLLNLASAAANFCDRSPKDGEVRFMISYQSKKFKVGQY